MSNTVMPSSSSPCEASGCSTGSSLTTLSRQTMVTPGVLTGVAAKMIWSPGMPGRKNTPMWIQSAKATPVPIALTPDTMMPLSFFSITRSPGERCWASGFERSICGSTN
ncbi:hypothetical protein D3C81_1560440 [compost metagenome]